MYAIRSYYDQEEITNVIVASYLHDATKYMSLEENIAYASKILTKPVLPARAHAYAAKRLAQERNNFV